LEETIRDTEEKIKNLEKFGKTSEYIQELTNLAILQIEINQYSESQKNLQISLEYFKKQKDALGQAAAYGVLGALHFKSSEHEKSIDYYNKAYDIYKKHNQVEEQITCLKGIGSNLIKMNQLDGACDVFLECSALCSDNNDIYSLLDCLGNLIQIHEEQNNWEIVFELYKKTLNAFEELNDVKGIIIAYFNLGILKRKENDYNEAIIYFKKGTNKSIDSNYTELILKGLSYVGEILVYQGEMHEAKEAYIKALSIAEEIKVKNSILQIRILLNSLGLSEDEINKELTIYLNRRKN